MAQVEALVNGSSPASDEMRAPGSTIGVDAACAVSGSCAGPDFAAKSILPGW
jgi:hypothetical protein